MKLFLTFIFVIFSRVLLFSQFTSLPTSLNGSQIFYKEDFNGATIVNPATATNAQWTYTYTSGSVVPTIITIGPATNPFTSNEGWETGSTGYTQMNLAANNETVLWTPSATLPNIDDLWMKFELNSTTNLGIGSSGTFSLSLVFDANFDETQDATPAPFGQNYTSSTYYGESTPGMFPNASGRDGSRHVNVNLNPFRGLTGRIGIKLKASAATKFGIDYLVIGTRPINDACAGAIALPNGLSGPFNNYLATGPQPTVNQPSSPTSANDNASGGAALYMPLARPGDGYEPKGTGATNAGLFSSNGLTVENSIWFKFTTPTIATLNTAPCSIATPTSISVKVTYTNEVSVSSLASTPSGMQCRVYRALFTCGSANIAITEQLVAVAAVLNNNATLTFSNPTITFGATYYIVFDGVQANMNSFYINTETIVNSVSQTTSPCTLLPIELLYFKGQHLNNANTLNWATGTELNNAYFEVEKSTDAINFVSLAKIKSQTNSGNSSAQLTYNYTDVACNAYYRIKQVDFDGRYKYHNTIFIANTDDNSKPLIMPNPASNELSINFNSKSNQLSTIKLCDVSGREILTEQAVFSTDKQTYLLNIEALKVGLYFLTIDTGFKTYQQKIVKE